MLVQIQPVQVQSLSVVGSQAHDLGVQVQVLSLHNMYESCFLASLLLLYLLLGQEAFRSLFLFFVFLLSFLLIGSDWVTLSKVVLLVSSLCLSVLSSQRGSLLLLLLVTLASLLLVSSAN